MFDIKNQNCAFAEQTVSFLYGELEAENHAAFETHVQNCAPCAEELHAFGSVRNSIHNWRAREFDSLEIPKIEIQYEPKNQPQKIAPVSTKNSPWLDGFRQIFSTAPSFAFAAALLFTAACVGLIAYNFSGRQQIADINSPQIHTPTSETNTNRAPEFSNETNKNEKQFAAAKPSDANAVNNKNTAPQIVKERRAVKISDGAKKETVAQKTYNSPTNHRILDANTTVAQNNLPFKQRNVPRLSSIEDDDDDASLRLTDLLDDAGGK